jgi:hypothetical protein
VVLADRHFLQRQLLLRPLLLLHLLQQRQHARPLLGVEVEVQREVLLLLLQSLDLLFQKLGEFFLAAVVLVDQSRLHEGKDAVELVRALLIAPQQFLLHVGVVRLVLLQQLPISVQPGDLRREFLLGHEEVLVLLAEFMAGMLDDAFDADVSVIGLAVELEGLVVEGTELVISSNLFLLAGQLQDDEVFGEHVGFDLRIVFVAAGRAVQELLLVVDDREALLADRVPAV